MRKILEELYHGNLSVDERTIRAGSKYARALAEVAKIEEALYEKIPEIDHALLRDYALASAQLANVSMVEDFIIGIHAPLGVLCTNDKGNAEHHSQYDAQLSAHTDAEYAENQQQRKR